MHLSSFNPFPNKPLFLCVCRTSLLKTLWEKEKLLVTINFSFSHSVFFPFWIAFCYFHQIWNCHLQALSVWKRLKFVVWERDKEGMTQIYLMATPSQPNRCNSRFSFESCWSIFRFLFTRSVFLVSACRSIFPFSMNNNLISESWLILNKKMST